MAEPKRERGRPLMPAEEKKGKLTACRMLADERDLLDQAAEQAGLSISDWMRSRLLKAAKKELRTKSG
jgi:uncharacterized protein (DUF1778 family)